MRRAWIRLLVLAVGISAALLLASVPAGAACHHFTVTARPATVTEGGKVTVTVSRDASFAPSNVDVSTVDGTARAGRDYTAFKRTVSFGSETEQTFSLSTTNDTVDEPNETFRLHLSNPGGCPVNTDFELDPDARVTIRDNDAAPKPQQTASAVAPRATQTTATASPSPRVASPSPPSEIESPSPSPNSTEAPPVAAPEGGDGGGLSGGAIAGIVIGAAALIGAITAALLRRRGAAG